MNRREFFRRASLIAAGALAADQIDLAEKISDRARSFFFMGDVAARADFELHLTPLIAGVDLKRGSLVRIGDDGNAYPVVMRGQWNKPMPAPPGTYATHGTIIIKRHPELDRLLSDGRFNLGAMPENFLRTQTAMPIGALEAGDTLALSLPPLVIV